MQISGHSGQLATAVARSFGVTTVFTLSGAHIFPVFDGAVHPCDGAPPLQLIDVRHEQTAAFAAEATGKLTRSPGLAALTAGPGITNAISAMAQARLAGSPLVILGGRSPANQWGKGALQELDQVAIVESLTKYAATASSPGEVLQFAAKAFDAAASAHRGPAYLDIPFDVAFATASGPLPAPPAPTDRSPAAGQIAQVAALLAGARRPVMILGTDVWADRAEAAARTFVEGQQLPTITTGMGRGLLPGGHPLLVGRARRRALAEADLVVVAGTPLDFRLNYGQFGALDGPATPVVHLADSAAQIAEHVDLAGSFSGDLSLILTALAAELDGRGTPERDKWMVELQETVSAARAHDAEQLGSSADPIHPARILGELASRLDSDAVVIGDGGDFVSFAGRYLEPRSPGCWLDPGPFGCLGAGVGAAIAARLARPAAQVVLLLGDGAAGFSLIDVDTLVRHNLPVVMVVGNNGAWGLEKGPMHMLYGYDVAADLAPRTRYDEVVRALGGAGEMVDRPDQIGPALDRAFGSGVPYLVNVITDVAAGYPRQTFGV